MSKLIFFQGWAEASAGVCTAPDAYTAPCASFAHFSAMSASDKALFESRCQVCWPCSAAAASFVQIQSSGAAPEYPTLNLHVAEPSDAAAMQSLNEAKQAMRMKLAALEANQVAIEEEMASAMASVTAQLGELISASGQQSKSVSFLASKVLPVDAYKIRNSLYVTQPLRAPAQAAVNVISKEDVGKMGEEAKYKGMLAQTVNIMKVPACFQNVRKRELPSLSFQRFFSERFLTCVI